MECPQNVRVYNFLVAISSVIGTLTSQLLVVSPRNLKEQHVACCWRLELYTRITLHSLSVLCHSFVCGLSCVIVFIRRRRSWRTDVRCNNIFLVLTANVSSLLQHHGTHSTRLLGPHIEFKLVQLVRTAAYLSGDFTKRVVQHIL